VKCKFVERIVVTHRCANCTGTLRTKTFSTTAWSL